MQWSPRKTLEFIEEYRWHEILWNKSPQLKKVKRGYTRRAAFKLLADKFLIEVKEVKGKIKLLRSQFFKEHKRVVSGTPSAWYGYEPMIFLLKSGADEKAFSEAPIVEIPVNSNIKDSDGYLGYSTRDNEDWEAMLEEVAQSLLKDEYSIYGEHIGNEIRKLNSVSQIVTKHRINEILFRAAIESVREGS